ncbi:MAG: response regulator [Phycisphaerae bacterium]
MHRKILLILLGLVALGGALDYFVQTGIIYPQFEQLQHELAGDNHGRVRSAIQRETEAVRVLVEDWAYWDDTFNYVHTRDPGYAKSNLQPETWARAKINLLALYNEQGRRIAGGARDSESLEWIPLEPFTETHLPEDHPLLVRWRKGETSSGLIPTRTGMLVLSASPVYRSDGTGKSPGMLVMGRLLTEEKLKRLTLQTAVESEIKPVGVVTLKNEVTALQQLQEGSKEVFLNHDGRGSLAVYSLLTDAEGKPTLKLETHTPRTITARGKAALDSLKVILAGISLVLLVAVGLLVKRWVTHPVRRLTEQVCGAREEDEPTFRFDTGGRDEIGTLARSFQDLTNRLRKQIEQRREVEQELRAARDDANSATEAKSGFLASMSHEIRTPLHGILGMTQLALETDLDDDQREYLSMARESGRQLLAILNDILDFSKIEAGRLELEQTEFDLRDLLCNVFKPQGALASESGICLLSNVSPDVPDDIVGDPVRLGQVLSNLLSNALKFTHEGEVELAADVLERSDQSITLRFSVRDTGIGIPPGRRDAIFEPFAQQDSTINRRFGGTGLGLAVCARLVELMHGDIWVDSEPDEGSTFGFTARFALPEAGCPAERQSLVRVLAQKRMLVVSSVARQREVFASLLERMGAEALTAGSHAGAVDVLGSSAADGKQVALAIVDAGISGEAGKSLIRTIAADERLACPVIGVVSHPGAREEMQLCQRDGASAVLARPVCQRELERAALQALGVASQCPKQETPSPAEPARQTIGPKGLAVLLAEDNPINAKVAAMMLMRAGHTVTVVEDGQAAVDAVRINAYDLVIMDVQMPCLSGLEATREIRRLEAEQLGRRVPIVALTANAVKGDDQSCYDAGMDGYVSKPVSPEKLFGEIERVLSPLRQPASKR